MSYALGARVPRGWRLRPMRARICFRHAYLQVVAHELRVLDLLVSGQMPAMMGMRKPSMRLRNCVQQAQVEDGLGDAELAAGFDFGGEAADLVIDVRERRGLPRLKS